MTAPTAPTFPMPVAGGGPLPESPTIAGAPEQATSWTAAAIDPSGARPGDLSGRSFAFQAPVAALMGAAVLGTIWWLADHEGPALRLAAAAVVTVVVVADAVSAWRAVGNAEVEVIPPRIAPASSVATYTVLARSLHRPVAVGILAPGWGAVRDQVVLDTTAPTSLPLPTPWRGMVDAQVFEVSASGPLGLMRCRRRRRIRYPVPMAVTIPPARHDLSWPRLDAAHYGDAVRRARGDDLFRGVREYVRGDSPRSVHWPATAHHRKLMTKETEGIGTIAIRVVVAFERPGPLAEAAVARAGWVIRRALAQGWTVELVTTELTTAPGHPPLRRKGPHFLIPAPPDRRTVRDEVHTPTQVDRRLAATVAGWPRLGKFVGPTRLVLPGGDQWR